jgi:hypothetical protein
MTRTDPAAGTPRATWRSTARIDRMFWRSVDLDGIAWHGLRTSITCSACFRPVTTAPLPVAVSPRDAHRALYDTYATHLTEHCEPAHHDRRDPSDR